ncbi:MAG: chromosome partitioning protein [Comamonadaceae bacterium]|nr:MAG: chromosome partitioning protein [Comamonadaceae bacterium]
MPVIAVVNRKGGSGKSTLAAHVAAWCAHQGSSVMLGDVDRQQSARSWLKRRDPALPQISPWAVDQKNMLRVPSGITHVVLDTPGGLHGFELARVVMFADAIVMPLCNSVFDRESAEQCHAELMSLPRIASGRCKLVTVGMRIDGRTQAARLLRDWSEKLGIPCIGSVREAQLYVRTLERGMTIFDLPAHLSAPDVLQWKSILQWMRPVLYPPQAANDSPPLVRHSAPQPAATARPPARPVSPATVSRKAETPPATSPPQRLGSSLPESLLPAQESLVHGSRLSVNGMGRAASVSTMVDDKMVLSRISRPADGQIPRFLRRAS